MHKINLKGGFKAISLMLALVLVFVGVIGGTVAWLIAQTDEVVNTFTYGDINLDLDETDTELDGDDDDNTNDYEMIPGAEIVKDPVVTVKAGSVDNWLFVKLEKSANFDDFLTYTIAYGWTQLYDETGAEVEGVYYLFHPENEDEDVEYEVLMDNVVHVREEVTKEMLNALDADGASNYPTLTVTAYAVQHLGFEAVDGTDADSVNAAALAAWQTAQNP